MEKEFKVFLDKDGNWFINGEEVTHERLKLFLAKSVYKENNKYYLKIGEEKVELEFEDTPYIVKSVDFKHKKFILTINDGTTEVLNPGTLRVGKNNVLYCDIKDGVRARFSRKAYYQLAKHIQQDENGYYVIFQGKKFYIKE